MTFTNELDFENAVIQILIQNGWEEDVIKYPTEEDLLKNWASILFENNRGIDRLDKYPLTNGEMQQILEQINTLRTPLKLNGFINGKTVSIKRDNEEDKAHFGKEVSLKIYDRSEIAGGTSRYQIVQQPKFKSKSPILNDRRGDLMLLINGMPVIHIELKKGGVPVSQAYNQIEKYSNQAIFTGLFSLVQVFVAMEPNEMVYFANPGPDGKFNKDFYFHWADFNNEPINDWKTATYALLNIPMAHQLIGFYTVADDTDGVLKVMRSYQYNAANAISDRVSKVNWKTKDQYGGFIWHTTGSGKTMTSFKSAQLISNSKDADKVIFLMDRIELGVQSLREYQGFAEEGEDVQATENTGVLISKLKSNDHANTLIVTSIQKMSNIQSEDGGRNAKDIELINQKRIVFIVDEAHRSTFGDMLKDIKKTFPLAIFFGFTGTPIQDENKKKLSTTSTIFGNELHRYSIADGIRDKNVLGFDPYKVLSHRDIDVRRAVALEKAKAKTEQEAIANDKKSKVYYHWMSNEVSMIEVEKNLPSTQYERTEHQEMVVQDILDNWVRLSRGGKFHAIFATSSIPEAIQYYRLIKTKNPELKVTALFDPNIDNGGNIQLKEDGLVELITDYNDRYKMNFNLATFSRFKKDIASRLAHKRPYERIENEHEKKIDLLIVVDQMLTGFDSKWINTLYMDKILQYENIIQAFSRTNRLFGPDKPFGTIRYYRKPHTMEEKIDKAVKLYSGEKPLALFVQHLDSNLEKMNRIFNDVATLFASAGFPNFDKLPTNSSECGQFAKLFKEFNVHLEAAKIQGFDWQQSKYEFAEKSIEVVIDENTFLTLVQRYKELAGGSSGGSVGSVPYDIDGYLTTIDTGLIDSKYMNDRFEKYLKLLENKNVSKEQLEDVLNELHKSFASLTQDEQKYANIFLHDVQKGDAKLESGKTFREYVIQYQTDATDLQIKKICQVLGLDLNKLKTLLTSTVTEQNLNEFGRFDDLKNTVNKAKAKEYFEKVSGEELAAFEVNIKVQELLKEFLLKGGFEIKDISK
ncbi:MAG: type I restriction endonuclease subunit R [Halobacteriovoraceae bacterium]|nr:type I restriction endonuclease subunit R [Halobacteriovoraceae bacterium]